MVEISEAAKSQEEVERISDEIELKFREITELENFKEQLIGNDPKLIAKRAGIKLNNPRDRAQSIYQLLGAEEFYIAGKEGRAVDEILTGTETLLEKQAFSDGLKRNRKNAKEIEGIQADLAQKKEASESGRLPGKEGEGFRKGGGQIFTPEDFVNIADGFHEFWGSFCR